MSRMHDHEAGLPLTVLHRNLTTTQDLHLLAGLVIPVGRCYEFLGVVVVQNCPYKVGLARRQIDLQTIGGCIVRITCIIGRDDRSIQQITGRTQLHIIRIMTILIRRRYNMSATLQCPFCSDRLVTR